MFGAEWRLFSNRREAKIYRLLTPFPIFQSIWYNVISAKEKQATLKAAFVFLASEHAKKGKRRN